MPAPERRGPEPAKFQRTELKVILGPEDADKVRGFADGHLDRDGHAGPDGVYVIHTLYLDTARLDIYNRAGDSGGTKFRIRRYGAENIVWLECKRRRRTSVTKRRTPWPLRDLGDFLQGYSQCDGWAKTFQDLVRSRRYGPRLLVSYPRRAWTAGPRARVTLDWNIEARIPSADDPFRSDRPPFAVGREIVVELKYDQDRPPVFDELLAFLGRECGSFSKYGRGVEAAGLAITGTRASTGAP